MNLRILQFCLTLILAYPFITLDAGVIKGIVYDRLTNERLIGAAITTLPPSHGTTTDIDGNFTLSLPTATHRIIVKYVGYVDTTITCTIQQANDTLAIDFPMTTDATSLSEITVTSVARKDTEIAMITEERQSNVVQTGVSAQQIAKTQDKDASEVIKRVPGISIIDDKFVNASGAETTPFTSAHFKNVTMIGPKTIKNADFVNNGDYITAGDLFPDNGSKLGRFQAAVQIRRSSKLNISNMLAVGFPIGLIVDGEKGQSVAYANTGQNYCPSTEISDGRGGYIGAFKNASDDWMNGWTNFDPQNTAY